jgi:hypothetical protein
MYIIVMKDIIINIYTDKIIDKMLGNSYLCMI